MGLYLINNWNFKDFLIIIILVKLWFIEREMDGVN